MAGNGFIDSYQYISYALHRYRSMKGGAMHERNGCCDDGCCGGGGCC
jgi:hypothetical protein